MTKNQYLKLGALFVFILSFFLVKIVLAQIIPYVSIDLNTSYTKTRYVQLYIQGPENTVQMMVSDNRDFTNVNWETYQTRKPWLLSYGTGTKTVYLKFRDKNGNVSTIYSDTIQLSPPQQMGVSFKINGGNVSTTLSRYVDLTFEYSDGVEDYIVSNDNIFTGKAFNPAVRSLSWVLTAGTGEKTVYVQFKDSDGKIKTINNKIKYTQPEINIADGALVKGTGNSIYYFGYDGELHPFLNSLVYHTWFKDFSGVRFINNTKLSQYHIGKPVCFKAGTWLLKFIGLPKVYAVEPGCQLRPIMSEGEAFVLYGPNWNQRILNLDALYASGYKVVGYDATDEKAGIEDLDHDGVTSSTEREYGTSDRNSDTDADGLSDYEEIFYWFSDPLNKDSDGDSINDLKEIKNGYFPAGYSKLTTIPDKTYKYPAGTVAKNKTNNAMYYRHSNGNYYSIGLTAIQAKFVAESPFTINMGLDSKGGMSTTEMEIAYPTQKVGDVVVKL